MFRLCNLMRTVFLATCLGLFVNITTQTANAKPTLLNGDKIIVGVSNQWLTRSGITIQATGNKLYGSFVSDGITIQFETHRGEPIPRKLRGNDPKMPEYEIDLRFLDSEGKPFLTQIGGEMPLDPRWADSGANKNDADAANDFAAAAKLIATIKNFKFNSSYRHEQHALLSLETTIESAKVIENVERSDSTAQARIAQAPISNTYRHRIEIHHKSCCFGLGKHGATIGKYISRSGVTTTAVITCNHGACANQMPLKCSWTSASPGFRNTRLLNTTACTTPYNFSSTFGHNSNDDTDLQYRAVRLNKLSSTTGGICNDVTVNTEPTDCY